MSQELISDFLDKLNDDAELRNKINNAADLDAVVAIANTAGFDISKADLIRNEATQALELSDKELEGVSGGTLTFAVCITAAIGTAAAFGGLGGAVGGVAITKKLKR